jgi:hypothetical protein
MSLIQTTSYVQSKEFMSSQIFSNISAKAKRLMKKVMLRISQK